MKFRILSSCLVAAGLALFCVASVQAQNVNPQSEAEFQQYLSANPEVRNNPSVFNDPAWLHAHPGVANWLSKHPAVQQQASQMGAYDNHNQWHNADWWHQNDPNWVNQHHPNWAKQHPNWNEQQGEANEHHGEANEHQGNWNKNHPQMAQGDGDYDQNHHWQTREWWVKHHPNWVKQHHPNWE